MRFHKGSIAGKPLIVVVSPGAGRILRGYEAFASELAGQLSRLDCVRVLLLQGGRPGVAYARAIKHFDRHNMVAQLLSSVTPLYSNSVEHYSFGLMSLPRLIWEQPHAVILAERVLANFYARVFRSLGQKTLVVLRNGGSHKPPFRHVNTVVHHTPESMRAGIEGADEGVRHVFLPYALELAPTIDQAVLQDEERSATRRRLGLPHERKIIITVGAIDSTVKRMNHLILELGALPNPRPYLVILGQREKETRQIEELAENVLGSDGHAIKSVPHEVVWDYLRASDLFVLASPKEGFGRVYVEALAAGLPEIVHDCPHTRWILGEHADYVDMTSVGQLSAAIARLLQEDKWFAPHAKAARCLAAYGRFSWDRLLPGYLDALGIAGVIDETGCSVMAKNPSENEIGVTS